MTFESPPSNAGIGAANALSERQRSVRSLSWQLVDRLVRLRPVQTVRLATM